MIIQIFRPDNLHDINVKYKKYWPSILYPCQNLLSHGVRFVAVPRLGNADVPTIKCDLAWKLSALLLSTQALWTAVESTSLYKSKWHGWFLNYLSKHCFKRSNSRTHRGEVFKLVEINTIERYINNKLSVNSLVKQCLMF